MTIHLDNDRKIIDSLFKNATPWIVAIQKQQIESRKFITDRLMRFGNFELAAYADITASKLAKKFDIIVANFSLIW
jgi:hypothetical protein